MSENERMSGALVFVLLGLLVVVSPADATVITVHSPIPSSYTMFGGTIDSVNRFLAVGAGGQVLVFDSTNGSLIRTFVSPKVQYSGDFGRSVEISGNLLVVGAPGETVNGLNTAGRVHIFNIQTGVLLDTLASSNPEGEGNFGRAIDAADGLLAVGAPFETVNGVEAGRVHIFDLRTGTETMTLATPNPVAEKGLFGAFGATINIAEGRIVIGAPGENHASGRVYVFDTNGLPAQHVCFAELPTCQLLRIFCRCHG
ncbi:MAG TPA: hypothetical protein VFE98_03470 [Candidatus Bathyarchaeia archaeon]|nr:hypothetical protein [Candidatus Bathyarchaeia archaeon]